MISSYKLFLGRLEGAFLVVGAGARGGVPGGGHGTGEERSRKCWRRPAFFAGCFGDSCGWRMPEVAI
jgi:hypothetical protein